MTDLEKLKEYIWKETHLNGEAICEWDDGFDAALRLVSKWIQNIEKENV